MSDGLSDSLAPKPAPTPGRRNWVEPSDKHKPKWVVPPHEVASLPPCAECKRPFKLDGANGVSGGIVVMFGSDKTGKALKTYYHGYPDVPGRGGCYAAAEKKGFPNG